MSTHSNNNRCGGCQHTTEPPTKYVSLLYVFTNYMHMVNSVEIPTRCSFVIEFIIPTFIEGSACFERHTAHHQEL